MRRIAKYGWKPDTPDHRDFIYNERNVLLGSKVPAKVDCLTSGLPIYDQGQLGSCTGNGWAKEMEYRESRQGEGVVTPSRLFIYYNERVIENTVSSDSGAEVRTGAQVVATIGAPPETDWPYDITKFTEKPSVQAYDDAKKQEALQYQRIVLGAGSPIRSAIASGLPVVFGFSVPQFFEDGSWDPTTAPLPLPTPTDQIIGGHCVVMTGYDFTCTQFPVPAFLCDNSWGPDWGASGRFWMDYRYGGVGLASDFWVVQKVS